MTPLQLGALVSAIANGGTLFYLQHPTSPEEVVNFRPAVKRQLEIGRLIDQISDGMAGAVNYGTARRVHYSFHSGRSSRKNGDLFPWRHALRLVWFLCQYQRRPDRGRRLPARRSSDLRPQSG